MLPKQSIGAEIGVHLGDFSQQLLDAVSPVELHLIDPWEHQAGTVYKDAWYGGAATAGQAEMDARHAAVHARFEPQIRAGSVRVHRGYSDDVLARFPDGYFDWVYIDGNHLYEYVMKDLELATRKTKAGGLITGDDYAEGGWWDGGVKRAVDEHSRNPSVARVAIRDGQFIFRKIPGPA